MKLEYTTEASYGHNRMYLVDQAKADALMILTGRKTVSTQDKQALEALGFEFIKVDNNK